jgi:LuxR family maltose regulon positive regulatory protein
VPGSAIWREQLVRRLNEASQRRVTLLIAPPGSGKSVLLAQWASQDGAGPTAWLTFEPADDDAVRLANRLVELLRGIDPTVGETALERLESTGLAMGSGFIDALLEDLSELPTSTLLIEDLHVLHNAPLIDEVGHIITSAPPHVHFMISSRSDPGISLQRLRLLDEVTELRQDVLALDDNETAEVLRRVANLELDDAQLAKLTGRVEGWAAGVQLAALSLREADDTTSFIDNFAGDDRAIADYLTEEILGRLPESVRQFLLRTSVLDRLTAPLCDAVTGDGNSQRMLELLDHQAMFVIPLDNRRGWFRYHQLFRDLLRYTLLAEDAELERTLLDRAAGWHLAESDLDSAVTYLAQARAWDKITDLVLSHGRPMWEHGDATTAVRWLESVPDSALATRPALKLAAAVLYLFVGRTSSTRRIFSELESGPALTPGERLIIDTFRSMLVQIDLQPSIAIDAADRVLADVKAREPREIPDVLGLGLPSNIEHLALNSKGRALFYDGDPAAGREYIARSLEKGGSASPSLLLRALGSAALVEAWTGHLVEAESLGERALGMANETDLVAHPSTADGLLALALVAYERNELDQASHLLEEAASRSRVNRRYTLLAIHGMGAALIDLALRRPDAALRALEVDPGDPPIPQGIAARRRAIEAHLLMASGDMAGARALIAIDAPPTPELRAAAIHLSLARGDGTRARKLTSKWPVPSEPRPAIDRQICDAIVSDHEGHTEDALRSMTDAVELAEREGHVRVFLDAGPPTLRVLRELERRHSTAYLRRLSDGARSAALPRVTTGLVEQLSSREMVVLSYLPSRYSNPEIATRLYVSTNTLKTHLKHIYRKLGVTSRNEAIEAAEALGLL